MTNPFEKRATEYLRDDSAFLSVVTPEPLDTFFKRSANDGSLYDRLCMVIGTPGSGKTTIASLLQVKTVLTLLGSPNHTEYPPLISALRECGIIESGRLKIVGCRIPMESEYRDFWELPYSDDVKFGLLKSFLQSRAVISWINGLCQSGWVSLSDVSFVYREGSGAAVEGIGGTLASEVLEKAKEVEKSIYSISAALVAPVEGELPNDIVRPYHPFDAIEAIIIHLQSEIIHLKPLVMFDDAHSLHPKQFLRMRDWLARREMRVSRWMLMRLDAQTPESVVISGVVSSSPVENESTIKVSREITFIWLQSNEGRGAYRKKFRVMAKNMADKYLRLMPVFYRQGLTHVQDLLNTKPPILTPSKLERLRKKVKSTQNRLGISNFVRNSLEAEIDQYASSSDRFIDGEDVKLSMLKILMGRYAKRVPQNDLFGEITNDGLHESNKPLRVDAGVADGARIHLLHEYDRPYYYGIESVCDASSENAEQFLQFAGRLVSASETRIIRGESSELTPAYQHKLLRKRAEEVISEWLFPRHVEVKKLCEYIASECKEKSLELNASLGGGANAFGIPQEEFESIVVSHRDLAHILKFGIAYNAISLKPNHKTKNKHWVLIELTGPFLISKGLTFSRGGFLERRVNDLLKAIKET